MKREMLLEKNTMKNEEYKKCPCGHRLTDPPLLSVSGQESEKWDETS